MRWVVVGTLAILGTLGFVGRAIMVFGADLKTAAASITACAVGGFLGAATMRRHLGQRGWEAPVAGALAVLVAGGFLRWIGAHKVLAVISLPVCFVALGASTLGAYAGARVAAASAVRPPTALTLWILSGFVTQGVMMALATPFFAYDHMGMGILAMFGCAVFGGFLTQQVSAVRRVWACGSGAMMMVLLFADLGPPVSMLLGISLGFTVYAALGALGARIAVHYLPKPTTLVEIPKAEVLGRIPQ